MKLSNVPFYLTLISGVLPLFAAFFDSELFIYLPFALTVIALLLFWVKSKWTFKRESSGTIFLFLFLVAHGVFMHFTIGYGSLGLLGLVLTVFIYLQLFNGAGACLKPDKLINQLIIIYCLHLTYLFVEFFFRLFGYQNLLLSLFGFAENVTKLKSYNSAAFLQTFVGLPEEFFGLGGLLLGSQSAGQVMACAFIVSGLWYKYSPLKGMKHLIFNILALLAFLFAINMTMMLAIFTVFLLMVYIIPFSRIKTIAIQGIVLLVIIVFFQTIISLLLFRLSNFDQDVEIYLDAFMAPVASFLDFNLWEIIFGLGRQDVRASAADFGAGMLINQIGLLFVLIVSFTLSNILLTAFRESKKAVDLDEACLSERKKWVWLATVNGLISFVFALGLIHYTPSIELGGLQMFAFSIALTIISNRNLRRFRCVEIK
jgi:hypothetical protein